MPRGPAQDRLSPAAGPKNDLHTLHYKTKGCL